MRIFMAVLGLGLALALAGGAVHAQTYRWVDKDGKKRYGDVAPPGVKATLVNPPAGGAQPAQAEKGAEAGKGEKGAEKKGPAVAVSPEQAFRERQLKAKEAQDKAEKERLAAEQKKQNCAAAQASLRTLESGRRVSNIDAKGERVVLDESQINARIEVARKTAGESCN